MKRNTKSKSSKGARAPQREVTSRAKGIKGSVVSFYRASEKPYGPFSNLYRRSMVFENVEYATSEHAYQAGKPRTEKVRKWLLDAPSPALLAMAAHGLYSWDVNQNWAKIKVARMRDVLLAKFTQHDDLRALLISTGEAELVESATVDNPVNRYWGRVNGRGQNMLGKLLMEVRKTLAAKRPKKARRGVKARSG